MSSLSKLTKRASGKLKASSKKKIKEAINKTGQHKPQSEKFSLDRDAKKKAKPSGWRYTDAGAKALHVNADAKPTAFHIKTYKTKTLKNGDRYLYQEDRVDKSDVSKKNKFEEGGQAERKITYNYFYYNSPIPKNEFLSNVPEDWETEIIDDEYSFGGYRAVIREDAGDNNKFAKGGKIKNQYEGKLDRDIWAAWTKDQRKHFLNDHFRKSKTTSKQDRDKVINELISEDWYNLPMEVQIQTEVHRIEGEYAQGGKINFVITDRSTEDTKYYAGLNGWVNLPENAFWYKTKKEAVEQKKALKENGLRIEQMEEPELVSDEYLEEVLENYMEAALWSSTDLEDEEPLDANFSISDISDNTVAGMRESVKKFLEENKEALDKSKLTPDQIGHSLWLSANGHGAGFFDYSLDDDIEKQLMDAARQLGETYLEVGDDGKIHGSIHGIWYSRGGMNEKASSEVMEAIFAPNEKNGEIRTAFGNKTKEGLIEMIHSGKHTITEISNAIFTLNEKNGKIKTDFGNKTKEELRGMLLNVKGLQYSAGGTPLGSTVLFAEGGEVDKYKIVDGTSYHKETPDKVVSVLENARKQRIRLVLDYGDVKTGKSWGEVFDIKGYVGRSTGTIKIPLLVYNERSSGGGAILDKAIVKISESKGGKVLYQHPDYKPADKFKDGGPVFDRDEYNRLDQEMLRLQAEYEDAETQEQKNEIDKQIKEVESSIHKMERPELYGNKTKEELRGMLLNVKGLQYSAGGTPLGSTVLFAEGGEVDKYKIVDGTSYHKETPDKVVSVLENARKQRIRLVLDYGDVKTGKSWGEVFDIKGYVGRSTGTIKIPLLVYNERSSGGGAILDKAIVKISESKGGKVLYQHPDYKPADKFKDGGPVFDRDEYNRLDQEMLRLQAEYEDAETQEQKNEIDKQIKEVESSIHKMERPELYGNKFADGGSASDGSFSKKITLGKVDYEGKGRKVNEIEVKVEIKIEKSAKDWESLKMLVNVPVFSCSVGVWNSRKTDIIAGGQMVDELERLFPDDKKIKRLVDIWEEYHLNDLQAGTIKQQEAIESWELAGNKYDYTAASKYLKSIGLYEDRGYKYGTDWLYMPIPESVIKEIKEIAGSYPDFQQYYEDGGIPLGSGLFDEGGSVGYDFDDWSKFDDPIAAQEIDLYAENDEHLYQSRYIPIVKNLKRKLQKGVFDVKLAAKLWKYYFEDADKRYQKDFGEKQKGYILSVKDRNLLSERMAVFIKQEYDLNKLEGYAKGGSLSADDEETLIADAADYAGEKIQDLYDDTLSSLYETDERRVAVSETTGHAGFIPFASGGRELDFFIPVSYLQSTGKRLPTKTLDKELERQLSIAYEYGKEWFIENYPGVVEKVGKENISYSDLREAGFNEEAEELDEAERANMQDEDVMISVNAFIYKKNSADAIDKKTTCAVQGVVNMDPQYHQAGKNEEAEEEIFSFSNMDEFKEKFNAALSKINDWLGGGKYEYDKSFAKGGGIDAVSVAENQDAPDDQDILKRGGVLKIANAESHAYSENKMPFKGANLEGKTLDNGDYVVLGYGYYPIWYFDSKENKWYGNADKFSKTTSLQMSQSKPTWEAVMLPHTELLEKMKKEDAAFDLGGIAVHGLPISPDNTGIAHNGSAMFPLQ